MKTFKEWIGWVLQLVTGYGFYGLGLLGLALLSWFLVGGYVGDALAWALIGAFVGKNVQAIKENLGRIKF